MNWNALLQVGYGLATTIASVASDSGKGQEQPRPLKKPCGTCPKMKFRGFGAGQRRAQIRLNKVEEI
jgi:hypothetical protein